MKTAVALAVVVSAAASANAATVDLGAIGIGTPRTFNGSVIQSVGTFTDTYTFSLPDNGGSGYSVINFPLAFGTFSFNTIFSALTLYSAGTNGLIGGGDDVSLATATSLSGAGELVLSFGPSAAGNYFLDVFGRTDGATGGLYSGSISVSPVLAPVPEPESYAMLLAGLGVMGAIAVRRNKAKK